MKKAAVVAFYILLFAGSLWAAGLGPFTLPQFKELSSQMTVAIGDTKITDDGVGDDSVSAEGQAPTSEESNDPSGFSVKLVSIHQIKVAKSKSNKMKPLISGKTTETAVKVAEGNFTIQLSSYLTEIEAKSAVDKFQKSKLNLVWMSTAEVAGKTRYRVYSGRFKTLTEARAAQSKVAQDSGIKEAFVQKVYTKLTAKND